MNIKTIPLSSLDADLKGPLSECAASGQAVVVQLPDQSLLAIQPLDPQEDEQLIDQLLKTNPRFQEIVNGDIGLVPLFTLTPGHTRPS